MGSPKKFVVRVGGRYEPPRWLSKSGSATPLKSKGRRFSTRAEAEKAADAWNYDGAGTNLVFHPARVE